MRLKTTLLASLACLALAPVGASSADAATHWKIGGGELVASETVRIFGGPWTLAGSVLGTPVELSAESVGCSGTCTIFGAGESKGGLTFTGVKVVKPANCTAGNVFGIPGTLATEALVDKVMMDPSNASGPVFDRLSPSFGPVLAEVEFHGAKCALAELEVPLEGRLNGEFPSATGVEKVVQSLTYSTFAESTGGGFLDFGTGLGTLTGTAFIELSGPNSGKGFAPTE